MAEGANVFSVFVGTEERLQIGRLGSLQFLVIEFESRRSESLGDEDMTCEIDGLKLGLVNGF